MNIMSGLGYHDILSAALYVSILDPQLEVALLVDSPSFPAMLCMP